MTGFVLPIRSGLLARQTRARRWIVPSALLPVAMFSTGISTDRPASPVEMQTASARVTAMLGQLVRGRQQQILSTGGEARDRNELIPFTRLPLEDVAGFRAIDPSTASYPTALKCLSQAIFYEAANENRSGKLAVAQVVLNRLRHPAYPKSVCGVVYEGWNAPVCQFSFTCDGSLLRPMTGASWRESQDVAKAALAGATEKSVGSATNYHADYVTPRWAFILAKVQKIGTHIFYRFPDRWGGAQALTGHWNGSERIPSINREWLEGRLSTDGNEQSTEAASEMIGHVVPTITDRHAVHDVGGRLDPTKEWRLAIPDPVSVSSRYHSEIQRQTDDLAEPKGPE